MSETMSVTSNTTSRRKRRARQPLQLTDSATKKKRANETLNVWINTKQTKKNQNNHKDNDHDINNN